jgi:uncharacterized protein (DUF1684 family)
MKNIANVSLLCLVILSTACQRKTEIIADWDSYIKAHEEWQETRLERLKSERGWLNLAGLFWLEEGENSFGSAPSNTIVFPEKFPRTGGSLRLSDSTVTLTADPAAAIFAGGEQLTRAALKSDQQENTTTLETGSYRWFIIRRGDRFGIRLRDLEHPRIGLLDNIPSYPFSKKWVVEAELVRFDSARTIEVPTVIDGFTEQYEAPGELTFRMNGRNHTLLPFRSGNGYFLIFGDGTSGLETYGGGRFLYTDRIEDGKVIIDFNRAYNPPCAFSPFATCPLPPPENFLDLEVNAGEKGVHLD